MYLSTVTVAKKASVDANHVVTYGTAATVLCDYQEMITKVLDQNGNEIITSAWLQFPALTSILYSDKITLPSGATPAIASINHIKNHLGVEVCVEVYLANSGGSL